MSSSFQELINSVPTSSNHLEDFYDIFPALIKLQDTPQDAIYHAEGDVWTHTKMVCEALFNLKEYQDADNETKFVLFYAALLHDISKPACTLTNEEGRISSAGHSKLGAIDSRILLWEKEVPFEIRERICSIINVHQLPFYAFYTGKVAHRPQRNPELLGNRLSYMAPMFELFTLARADMIGRVCPTQKENLDNLELFQELCIENGCFYSPKQFPDDNTRIKYFRSEGNIASDYPFFYETGSEVIVMSGLPATGKDFWISQNAQNLPVIGFDLAEAQLGLKHGENNGKVAHYVQDQAKEFLRKKEPFVFNATHIVPDLRAKTLDLLHSYQANVKMVYLEAPKNVILSRNSQRDTSLKNEHIEKMIQRWDIPTLMEVQKLEFVIQEPKKTLQKKFK